MKKWWGHTLQIIAYVTGMSIQFAKVVFYHGGRNHHATVVLDQYSLRVKPKIAWLTKTLRHAISWTEWVWNRIKSSYNGSDVVKKCADRYYLYLSTVPRLLADPEAIVLKTNAIRNILLIAQTCRPDKIHFIERARKCQKTMVVFKKIR